MMSHRIPILIIFLAIIAISIAWTGTRPHSLCANLSCIRMTGISAFREKEIYENTPVSYRALFTDARRMLRIEVRKTKAASLKQEENAAVIKMKALFEKAPAPYPGDVSDTIVCDEGFIPTVDEIQNGQSRLTLFTGYLNSRLTFGSCSQDQAVYRGLLVFTHCPEHSLLLRVELIAPVSDDDMYGQELRDQIITLACNG